MSYLSKLTWATIAVLTCVTVLPFPASANSIVTSNVTSSYLYGGVYGGLLIFILAIGIETYVFSRIARVKLLTGFKVSVIVNIISCLSGFFILPLVTEAGSPVILIMVGLVLIMLTTINSAYTQQRFLSRGVMVSLIYIAVYFLGLIYEIDFVQGNVFLFVTALCAMGFSFALAIEIWPARCFFDVHVVEKSVFWGNLISYIIITPIFYGFLHTGLAPAW